MKAPVRPVRRTTTRRLFGAVLGLALIGLAALAGYRLATGKSLGLISLARNAAWTVRSLVRAVSDHDQVAALSQGQHTNVIFLHHSVGKNLIAEGQLRQKLSAAGLQFWDQGYNWEGLTGPDGRGRGYAFNLPGDNTDPDGLHRLFQQPVYALPVNALSGLLQYEVILIKSCFTASDIRSQEQLEQYQAWYRDIRAVMDAHPDKQFLLLTPPPLQPSETTPETAARARAFASWLTSDEFLAGHPNLAAFDLFDALASGPEAGAEANMLREAYRNGVDSHPNQAANQELGQALAGFILAQRSGAGPAAAGGFAIPITGQGAPAQPAQDEAASPSDWPQVQRDPQRSGYTPEVLSTHLQVVWTHPFQPEKITPQVQAIVADEKVFVGTEMGNLYALQARTGQQAWVYRVGAPVLNSAAAANGRVYFGAMDGSVYALNTSNGALAWKKNLSWRLGFSTAPLIAEEKLLLGGRDGTFYALDLDTGEVVWQFRAGGAILQTAAYAGGRVFFGAMDMRVYALNAATGELAWKSERLAGMALKDYWPVVANGYVIVRPMGREMYNHSLPPGFPFTWFSAASDWQWLAGQAAAVAQGSLSSIGIANTAQDQAVAAYHQNPGAYTRTFYVLNAATGQEDFVVPHWSTQTMHGATTPPCLDRDGLLVVPVYFIRSGWGRLDLNTRRVVDILFDGKDTGGGALEAGEMPAGMGNNDENMNVTCTGNLVLALHTEEYNANYTGFFDQEARRWTRLDSGHTNRQMSSNTQGGGGNPASVANGWVYHLTYNELVARWTP